MILLGTQKQPDRRIIPFSHYMCLIPIQIGIQLSEWFVRKTAYFQFNQDMTLQNPVIKNKVYKEVLLPNQNPFLSCLKSESISEFKEK